MPDALVLTAPTAGDADVLVAPGWFCGYCAAPWDGDGDGAAAPSARVCGKCGMGLLLHARRDAIPQPGDAFIVVDSSLTVHAVSRTAELRLGVTERQAVGVHVRDLLLLARARATCPAKLAESIKQAASGHDAGHSAVLDFAARSGPRMRARIVSCGPPPAALLVLSTFPTTNGAAVQGASWAA